MQATVAIQMRIGMTHPFRVSSQHLNDGAMPSVPARLRSRLVTGTWNQIARKDVVQFD
jgi:hypothetical protein